MPLGTLGFTVAPGGGGIEDHLTREPLIPPIVLTRTSGPNLSGTNLALGPFVKLTKITALQAHFLLQSSSHSKVTFSLSYPGGEVVVVGVGTGVEVAGGRVGVGVRVV